MKQQITWFATQIRSFLQLILHPIPPEFGDGFRAESHRVNLTRGCMFAFLFAIMEAALIIFRVSTLGLRAFIGKSGQYMFIYCIMLFSMTVIGLGFVWAQSQTGRKSNTAWVILATSMIIIGIGQVLAITCLDLQSSGQVSYYFVGLVCLAMAPSLRPLVSLLLLCAMQGAFMLIAARFGSPENFGGYIINTGSMLIICWMMAIIAYRARLEAYKYRQVIGQQNEQLSLMNAWLEEKVTIDPLTGVLNRGELDNRLDHEWRVAMRGSRPLSLLMLDIDNFKKYNDLYGHPQGDVALKQVADVVTSALRRSTDIVARYGGEEFMALLPTVEHEAAYMLAQRIHDGLAALKIPHGNSKVGPYLTVSIGLVTIVPEHNGHDVSWLVDAADQAMYQAKNTGKNRTCVYNIPTASQ